MLGNFQINCLLLWVIFSKPYMLCFLAFGKLTLKLSHIGKRERWELPYIRELLMEYYFIITCTFGGPLWCEAPYHACTHARARDRGPRSGAVGCVAQCGALSAHFALRTYASSLGAIGALFYLPRVVLVPGTDVPGRDHWLVVVTVRFAHLLVRGLDCSVRL